MSWKTALLLSLSATLGACSPSDPAPSAAAPAPVKAPLPADILGIEVGKPLSIEKCIESTTGTYENAPCETVWGDVAIPEDRVPLRVRSSVSVDWRDGVVDQVVARIDRGDSAHIVNSMKDKYGPAYITTPDGEMHWTDENLAVAYVPAGSDEYGMVIVATQRRVQGQNARTEDLKKRPL
ncbi:MAG TPA: hypothetical protein VGE19_07315 [Pseudoxanthomonas sp.]